MRGLKLIVVGMIVTITAAFACPNGCDKRGDMNAAFAKHMSSAKMCDSDGKKCHCDTCKCNKGTSCKTKEGKCTCVIGGCNTGNEAKKMCNTKQPNYGVFRASIKYALRHVGLKKEDWADVKMAFHHYKESVQNAGFVIPPNAFKAGEFNREVFIKESRLAKKLEAKAELMETIMLLLNEEQRKQFAMLVMANEQTMKKRGFIGGGMCDKRNGNTGKFCNTPHGKHCD